MNKLGRIVFVLQMCLQDFTQRIKEIFKDLLGIFLDHVVDVLLWFHHQAVYAELV